ncbi:MAG: serine/threonine protein kinase [Labilithrix sp.]|nr:serine/threonine protein kinase [Labilithrix sp.]
MANPEDLGRYRLKRLLGRGALGEVWEATDLEEEGAKVAVKIMHAADEELAIARSAFAREARLASLLRHPHVVAVHDAGEAAGTSFMVMVMVDGTSLRKLLGDTSTTLAERLRWLRQVGDGLAAMHRAGVVHRDLKPENVIVRSDRTACVVDLGIVKWTKFDLGGERDPMDLESQLDTPASNTDYMPPETSADGFYDELGDQYAWGVLAYEVVTGVVPTEGAPPLTEREDIPPRTAAAIERARSYSRGDRWDGMEPLLDEIDEIAALDDVAGTSAVRPDAKQELVARSRAPKAVRSATAEPRARSPLAVGATVGVVVLIVLVGLIVAALR